MTVMVVLFPARVVDNTNDRTAAHDPGLIGNRIGKPCCFEDDPKSGNAPYGFCAGDLGYGCRFREMTPSDPQINCGTSPGTFVQSSVAMLPDLRGPNIVGGGALLGPLETFLGYCCRLALGCRYASCAHICP
jgi:hypothetical protein